jgi:hypothetical protein
MDKLKVEVSEVPGEFSTEEASLISRILHQAVMTVSGLVALRSLHSSRQHLQVAAFYGYGRQSAELRGLSDNGDYLRAATAAAQIRVQQVQSLHHGLHWLQVKRRNYWTDFES